MMRGHKADAGSLPLPQSWTYRFGHLSIRLLHVYQPPFRCVLFDTAEYLAQRCAPTAKRG
jgi:hypothetical protein